MNSWRTSKMPTKPSQRPYGYIGSDNAVHSALTLEELEEMVANEPKPVYLGWGKTHNTLIPLAEIEELKPTVLSQKSQQQKTRYKKDLRNLFILGIPLSAWLLFSTFIHNKWTQNQTFSLALTIGFISFVLSPAIESWLVQRRTKNLPHTIVTDESHYIRFDFWLHSKKKYASIFLSSTLVLFALLQLQLGGEIGDGFARSSQVAGLVSPSLLEHEYWRLYTAPLLHGGILHLTFNVIALLHFGKVVEALTHWKHILYIFLFAALAGSLCSLTSLSPGQISVGASGGILGYIGFLYAVSISGALPAQFKQRLIVLFFTLTGIGIVGRDFIDNAAHFGGVCGGFLYGKCYLSPPISSFLGNFSSKTLAIILFLLVSYTTYHFTF